MGEHSIQLLIQLSTIQLSINIEKNIQQKKRTQDTLFHNEELAPSVQAPQIRDSVWSFSTLDWYWRDKCMYVCMYVLLLLLLLLLLLTSTIYQSYSDVYMTAELQIACVYLIVHNNYIQCCGCMGVGPDDQWAIYQHYCHCRGAGSNIFRGIIYYYS